MPGSGRGRLPRRFLLVCGLVAIVGVLAYAAYRKGWFARDSENLAEIEKLHAQQLAVGGVADRWWPQWRGPNRDGRAPAQEIRTDWDRRPPTLLWKADVGGGYSSCAVQDGRVYTQDRRDKSERVICLDAETGKLLWDHTYPVDYTGTDPTYAIGPRATPTVVNGRVLTVGASGKMLCLVPPADPTVSKPEVRWEHDLLQDFGATVPRWGVACSPLVLGDGSVVVQPGGRDGSVVALDGDRGDLRWKAGSNPSGYSSPVAAGEPTVGLTVLALTGDALLAIRAADGAITDTYPWKTEHLGNIATPLVVGDYVFISAAYGAGSALLRMDRRGNGVKLVPVYARRGRAYQNHHSTSVYKDRRLFGYSGMTNSARLKCVDFETGKEQEEWEASGVGPGSGTLILSGNHLVIQTERGDLCLVEATAEEFRLVARIPRVLSGNNNWATPTLVGGRLYLRDEQKVLCYDVRP